ncbi:MAG: tetratricopeptide repeat protein [Melioribacteraceae bacterium]|nr:tetratricopeptide repeat protein [Melioribacteraceae bacterium]
MYKRLKIILSLYGILFVAACSSGSRIDPSTERDEFIADSLKKFQYATEKFVDGSMDELRGDYSSAVVNYLEALKYNPDAAVYFSLGKNYLRLNKIPAAIKNSQEAVSLDPSELEYKYLLAEVLSAGAQFDSAAVVLNKIIETDSLEFNAYYRLGEIYESDKPLRALELYERLVELSGPEWTVLTRMADLNERMGNIDQTITTIEELLEINPSNLQLEKLLIDSYLKSNRLEVAEKQLESAMALYPDDFDLIKLKAEYYARNDEWAESAGEYLKIIDNNKFREDEKVRVGSLFLQEAQEDSSLNPFVDKLFEKVVADSSNWQLNAFLGELALNKKDTTRAIKLFSDAANTAEWNSQLWIRLGILLFDSQQYEETTAQMTTAVEKFPDEFVINILLGLALSQENKQVQAEPFLQKALELNPNDITALTALGFALNQMNKNDDALIYLHRALELDSQNTQVLGMLGLIYNSRKKWELSDNYYEKALEIDSTNIVLLNNFAYSLSERGIKLERALSMVSVAVEKEPDNSAYLDTIGWIYYQMGDYELAKEYIEKAIDIDGDSATQIDHLGDVYFKLGDKNKAIDFWERALELDPKLKETEEKLFKGAL